MPAEPVAPVRAEASGAAALEFLLRVEEQARKAADTAELMHLAVNQTRKINRASQIFLVGLGEGRGPRVRCVSGLSDVDPESPLVKDIERLVAAFAASQDPARAADFTLPAFAAGLDLASSYPFREITWVPLCSRRGAAFAGLLMTRDSVWTSGETAISRRLGDAFAHAWQALAPVDPRTALWHRVARWRYVLLAGVLLALAIPVPMTALAPVEIVAAQAHLVSASIDGVIETVEVEPNSLVAAGDVLVRFNDTTLRSRRDVATWEVAVAQARVKQQGLLAFNDPKGRHDLALSEAELELKRTELAFAEAQLARSVIRAHRDGLVIFPDRRALLGRPVSTGERLMEIADPARVEARVDLAIADAIALRPDATVKLFLDVDPLSPVSGRVVRADHRARASDADVLVFRVFAEVEPGAGAPLRIGLRGTAQVRGDHRPLALVLFRRPISAARQWIGL